MSVRFETEGTTLVATLEGRLDTTNAPATEAELLKRLGTGAVVLDLAGLNYISSAGLRVVLVVAKRLKPTGRRFVLAGLPPHIREVFEVSGFLSILEVAADRAEALARV